MKSKTQRTITTYSLTMYVVLTLCGCLPSTPALVRVLNDIPIGITKEQMAEKLVAIYGKRKNWQLSQWELKGTRLLTQREIEQLQSLAADFRRRKRYLRVNPPDILEVLSPLDQCEVIAVSEASEGNGSVSVFFDERTNYMGYFACATGPDK